MPEGVGADWGIDAVDCREYWNWTGVALYLLLPVDLLTTLYAAAVHGVMAEANPYVRSALEYGPGRLVALNLLVLCVSVTLVAAYLRLLRRSSGVEAWVMARSFEVWLGSLIAGGLFVFANNLAVIVLGGSLL
jgi:hypothetical protein